MAETAEKILMSIALELFLVVLQFQHIMHHLKFLA